MLLGNDEDHLVRPTSVVVEGTTQESTDVDNVVVIKDSHREAKESARMRQREQNGINITTVSTQQQYDRFLSHSNAWLSIAHIATDHGRGRT